MHPGKLIAPPSSEKVLASAIFMNLHCNNSVRMHRIIILLEPFLINIKCTIGLCKLILIELLQFLPNMNHIVSHGLSAAGLRKAYILEATRTWHVQHEFSDCRCDMICFRYKDNFLTSGCNKNKT